MAQKFTLISIPTNCCALTDSLCWHVLCGCGLRILTFVNNTIQHKSYFYANYRENTKDIERGKKKRKKSENPRIFQCCTSTLPQQFKGIGTALFHRLLQNSDIFSLIKGPDFKRQCRVYETKTTTHNHTTRYFCGTHKLPSLSLSLRRISTTAALESKTNPIGLFLLLLLSL